MFLRDKYCFVHIPKNGGTSLKKNLGAHLGGEHFPAIDYKKSYPAHYDNVFKFAIVRNPFDRLLSIYHFYKYNTNEPTNSHIHKLVPDDFNVFVEQFFSDNPPSWLKGYADPILRHQKNWVCDEQGNEIVDFIGRFENYDNDVKFILDKLEYNSSKIHHLRKSNNREENDYRKYYSMKSLSLVLNNLSVDLEYFNYKF